jgi:hypothetical protein
MVITDLLRAAFSCTSTLSESGINLFSSSVATGTALLLSRGAEEPDIRLKLLAKARLGPGTY